MFAGLPELGISNGDDLKETLTNCTEPLKAIDQFQVQLIFDADFVRRLSLAHTNVNSPKQGRTGCVKISNNHGTLLQDSI